MAKGTRICKVCGCEYDYCKTNRPSGVFRYQDVACSQEHGSIYLAEILASRSAAQEPEPVQEAEVESVEVNTDGHVEYDVDVDEDDELFEEEFDDDDTEELEIEI